ncbi:MAG: DNA polymerase/3'-5' exonuclease PolX [Actinomycetota bacterium]
MPRANEAVAELLLEFADLLSILSDDRFKPRAYEKAAQAVGGYAADVSTLDAKAILEIPSVGRSIGEKVHEYLTSGHIAELEALRAQVPSGVRDMMRIPGLGPKKAMLLHTEMGIDSVDALRAALDAGTLAGLKGFGAKTEENLRKGIERLDEAGGRVLVNVALDLAERMLAEIERMPGVRRCTYAGSLRRMAETIGDVDLLVASTEPIPIMDAFVALPEVRQVLAHGDTKSSVVVASGLQVDLRVVRPEVWGAALLYFTGSKAHNIKVREMAVRKGLKLSEYGLFDAATDELIVAETEEEVYGRLGLPWISPELREDRGEVEAALGEGLPNLLTLGDILGDLHTHTDLTDGTAPLEDMLEAARAHGYAYYAVTDHAPDLAMHRMTTAKMKAQRKAIAALRERFPEMAILQGSELNIAPDGGVDWGPEFLSTLDVCVASVHSHFNQSREEMTRRLIRAMENPHVHVIGHMTTRLIGRRPETDFDHEAVFRAAARTGTAIEINAFPDRLDLKDEYVLWARKLGVKFAVDTDSHATGHLDVMRYGVATAARGWLGPDDVINAWPLERLRRFLAKRA